MACTIGSSVVTRFFVVALSAGASVVGVSALDLDPVITDDVAASDGEAVASPDVEDRDRRHQNRSGVAARSAQCIAVGKYDPPVLAFTPAFGATPWPLQLILDRSSQQITTDARNRAEPSRVAALREVELAGLTRLSDTNPVVRVAWAWTHASGPDGWCGYISAAEIRSPAIQIFIASQLAASSCEFRETLVHETLHYLDLSADVRQVQSAIKTSWGTIPVPTHGRPWYVATTEKVDAEVKARGRLDEMIRGSFQPIVDRIIVKAAREGDDRDRRIEIDTLESEYDRCRADLSTAEISERVH